MKRIRRRVSLQISQSLLEVTLLRSPFENVTIKETSGARRRVLYQPFGINFRQTGSPLPTALKLRLLLNLTWHRRDSKNNRHFHQIRRKMMNQWLLCIWILCVAIKNVDLKSIIPTPKTRIKLERLSLSLWHLICTFYKKILQLFPGFYCFEQEIRWVIILWSVFM